MRVQRTQPGVVSSKDKGIWTRTRDEGQPIVRVTKAESIVITTKGIETHETHDNTLPSRSVDGRNDLRDLQQCPEGSWGQLTVWNQ